MMRSQREHAGWRTSLPLDVLGASALALFVAVSPTPNASVANVLFGLVFVLFVPGYVVLAALFPTRPRVDTDADSFATTGLTWGERAALSVGASVAFVPLLAIAMAVASAPFTPSSMRMWLATAVLVVALLAAARRYSVAPEERLVVPLTAWFGSVYDNTVGASSRRDAVLNVVLVASILIALASVGFAVADADSQESYAGVSLLAENESGDLVAADHPTSLVEGESQTYVAAVQNHRLADRDYTLVTELQRLRTADDGSADVVESEVVSRDDISLSANENGTVDVSVSPSLVGEDLRLVTFLYDGDAPDDPSMESATQYVFLWVDVSPAGTAAAEVDDDATDEDTTEDGATDGDAGEEASTTETTTEPTATTNERTTVIDETTATTAETNATTGTEPDSTSGTETDSTTGTDTDSTTGTTTSTTAETETNTATP